MDPLGRKMVNKKRETKSKANPVHHNERSQIGNEIRKRWGENGHTHREMEEKHYWKGDIFEGRRRGGGRNDLWWPNRYTPLCANFFWSQVHAHKVTKHEGVLWIRGKEPHNTKASTDTIKEYEVGGYLRDIAHVEPRDVTTHKQTCKTHTYSLSIPPSFLVSWTRLLNFSHLVLQRSLARVSLLYIIPKEKQNWNSRTVPYRTVPYRTSGLRTQDFYYISTSRYSAFAFGRKTGNLPSRVGTSQLPFSEMSFVVPAVFRISTTQNTAYLPPPIKNKRLF